MSYPLNTFSLIHSNSQQLSYRLEVIRKQLKLFVTQTNREEMEISVMFVLLVAVITKTLSSMVEKILISEGIGLRRAKFK